MATGKMFLEPCVHVFLKVYEKHGRGGGKRERREKKGGLLKYTGFVHKGLIFIVDRKEEKGRGKKEKKRVDAHCAHT